MVIDRGEEVAGAADSFDDVFASFVGGSDEFAVLDASARPGFGVRRRCISVIA